MSARPLAPFLISFALLALLLASPGAAQSETPAVSTPRGVADEVRARLLSLVSRDLVDHFNVEGDLQLDPLRPWALPPATGAAAQTTDGWTVSLVEFPGQLASSMLFRIRITSPAGTTLDETLTCRAQLWRDAWVVRTPFERGAMFDPSSCDLRRIDALRERDVISTSLVRTQEWTFLRPVPAGRLVTWRDVSRRALVRKGSVIEVAAVDGPLQITLKAVAMQDGGQGETVRVRNIESKREFAALVVAENRAQVRF